MWIDQCFGGKNSPKNLMGTHFPTGRFQNCPTKSFFNYLGNNFGYNGNPRSEGNCETIEKQKVSFGESSRGNTIRGNRTESL